MSNIDASFQVCAIFGHPVGHSLSPRLHNAGFQALGLPYVYLAHDISPAQLSAAFQAVRVLGYRGLSITIPHKVAALNFVDKVDETAAAIGCINTVVNEGGCLHGYNSDGRGAIDALSNAGANPQGKQVVLLGSGGAARAIAMTMGYAAPPAKLTILGVDAQEVDKLAGDLRERTGVSVVTGDLSEGWLAKALAEAELLLQCTPLGMHPNIEATPVPGSLLRPEITVFDAVYNPRRTRFLQDAAAQGCRIVEGVEMFLGQAVVQFQLWTEKPAPVAIMRQVIEEER